MDPVKSKRPFFLVVGRGPANCFSEYLSTLSSVFALEVKKNFTLGVHRTFSSSEFIFIRSLCLLRNRNMEAVDTSWPVSTAIVSAHVAEKKVKVQILVFHIMIVKLVTHWRKNNVCSYPHLVIGLKKRNGYLRNLLTLPERTPTVPLLIRPQWR